MIDKSDKENENSSCLPKFKKCIIVPFQYFMCHDMIVWLCEVLASILETLRFCVLTNVKSASSPFAQSFSYAKAQQRSDNLLQHEMHEVYHSMTRGRLYRFFNGVVITKSSIDLLYVNHLHEKSVLWFTIVRKS